MNLSEPNDSRYSQVIDMLTPHHTPVTKMDFRPPKHRATSWQRLLAYAGRCAAILIAVIFIGQLVYSPDTTLAADKMIKLGLSIMRSSRTCRLDFVARMKPPKANRLFHMSPKGTMTDATLVYRSMPDSAGITLSWALGGTAYSLQISPDGKVTSDGIEVGEIGQASFFRDFAGMLYYDSNLYHDLLGDDITVRRSDSSIVVEGRFKNDNVGFTAKFSDSNDRLTSLRLFDTSVSPALLMLETTSVAYID